MRSERRWPGERSLTSLLGSTPYAGADGNVRLPLLPMLDDDHATFLLSRSRVDEGGARISRALREETDDEIRRLLAIAARQDREASPLAQPVEEITPRRLGDLATSRWAARAVDRALDQGAHVGIGQGQGSSE